MRLDIITIFPEVFRPYFDVSMLKIAQASGRLKIRIHNLRDYTLDKHRKVDDRPFGGGPGMVFTPEPIFRAVEHIIQDPRPKTKDPRSKTQDSRLKIKNCNSILKIKRPETRIILLTPQGKTLNQKLAQRLAKFSHLILICGHYEGVDERVRKYLVDEEVSIGDYVLTGGELAAMVLSDAVARFIPGVLGHKDSNRLESFSANLLEHPQYTRPANFRNLKVPGVLLSGDHKKVEGWRKSQAERITKQKRPDLYASSQENRLLAL